MMLWLNKCKTIGGNNGKMLLLTKSDCFLLRHTHLHPLREAKAPLVERMHNDPLSTGQAWMSFTSASASSKLTKLRELARVPATGAGRLLDLLLLLRDERTQTFVVVVEALHQDRGLLEVVVARRDVD